jgi:hypothetical protein
MGTGGVAGFGIPRPSQVFYFEPEVAGEDLGADGEELALAAAVQDRVGG